MYDPKLVQPMREELTKLGVVELRTPQEVDEMLTKSAGTTLVVVNSVCGCAAGGARPGVALALRHAKKPNNIATVFAGQDKDATDKARGYFVGYPPSSPCFALLKDGKIVQFVPRQEIEGRSPDQIAASLIKAFDTHC